VAKSRQPRQWDIWFAELRDGIKGEQKGDHHVLVLSSDFVHSQAGVALAAPITTTGSTMPWTVRVEPHESGLRFTSYIECHQAMSLSTSRVRFKTFRKRLAERKR
jgi:mRNA-degrading endonuclease toxin of MazEF toxin-antitoxin module